MADHALGASTSGSWPRLAEGPLHGGGLDPVVQLGAGAVEVDVVELLGRGPRRRRGPARWRGPARRGRPTAPRGARRRRCWRSRGPRRRSATPRARACSRSSSTSIQAPSPRTKPSRSRLNGRLARVGSSFQPEAVIFIRSKPVMMPGAIGASAPPVRTRGTRHTGCGGRRSRWRRCSRYTRSRRRAKARGGRAGSRSRTSCCRACRRAGRRRWPARAWPGIVVGVHRLDEFGPAPAGPEQDADLPAGRQVEPLGGQPRVFQRLARGEDRQRDHPADPLELPGFHRAGQVDPPDRCRRPGSGAARCRTPRSGWTPLIPSRLARRKASRS